MSKAILDTAEVIHDYMRNGDRSTSREECITWIARLIQEVSQQAPSATVDADALFDKYSIGDTGNTQDILTKELFVKALTEALRGSYTREDMIAFVHHCVDWNINNGKQKEYCRWWDVRDDVERTTEQLLIQYDTERGKVNGKV